MIALEEREKIILNVLEKMPKDSIILIGGYAVNAYIPPRFSIDCDLIVLKKLKEIKNILSKSGFKEIEKGKVPKGEFYKFEYPDKGISFDLLIESVVDRESGISLPAKFIDEYSKERITVGRANPIRIKLRIADPEVLFIMKFISCRRQDMRDLFMFSGLKLEWDFIEEVIRKYPKEILKERIKKINSTVSSKNFKDGLKGCFGAMPEEMFLRCQKNLAGFLRELKK